uniref:Uncharacterized protein n=1 Tax=Arundo donax TaxID=35708 RepID=A0A0A9FS30_ARUDO
MALNAARPTPLNCSRRTDSSISAANLARCTAEGSSTRSLFFDDKDSLHRRDSEFWLSSSFSRSRRDAFSSEA